MPQINLIHFRLTLGLNVGLDGKEAPKSEEFEDTRIRFHSDQYEQCQKGIQKESLTTRLYRLLTKFWWLCCSIFLILILWWLSENLGHQLVYLIHYCMLLIGFVIDWLSKWWLICHCNLTEKSRSKFDQISNRGSNWEKNILCRLDLDPDFVLNSQSIPLFHHFSWYGILIDFILQISEGFSFQKLIFHLRKGLTTRLQNNF